MKPVAQHLSPATVRVKPGDLSPDAQACWRFMRDEGGWYTSAELAAEMMPGVPLKESTPIASRWLVALIRRSHVARKPAGNGKFKHGVTARCFPIPGESLDPAIH